MSAQTPDSSPGRPVVRVGPAGWSYPDWKGRVYPPRAPRSFDPLRWITAFCDVLEINASFYQVPDRRVSAGWCRRVEARPGFRFTAKLHHSLTHDRTLDRSVLAAVRDFAAPLQESQRLTALLAQFPWSFRPDRAGRLYLRRLRDALEDLPLAVEVRHGDWESVDPAWFADQQWAQVTVDQPRVGHSLSPAARRTGPLAYVRVHGRNAATWFDASAGRDARYDYLYSPAELDELAGIAREAGVGAEEVVVITNNHYRGSAVANALQLRSRLGDPAPGAPKWLLQEVSTLGEDLAAQGHPTVAMVPDGESNPRAEGDRAGDDERPRQGSLF